MAKKNEIVTQLEVSPLVIQQRIHEIRGEKVMLDRDLAAIYGYSTKDFNRQVKNNIEKFDEDDFMFQLTENETRMILRCKISTAKQDPRCQNSTLNIETRGGRRYAPQFVGAPYALRATARAKALLQTYLL